MKKLPILIAVIFTLTFFSCKKISNNAIIAHLVLSMEYNRLHKTIVVTMEVQGNLKMLKATTCRVIVYLNRIREKQQILYSIFYMV